ncbi:LemA domain protein [Ectobacillus funiculus]|uniref:LemA domain protein n=1 Tax=Ectobacillus funiculus TaxID=137993 RepID=A0ABV5WCA3_9BACI
MEEKLRRIQDLAQEIVETLLQEAFFNQNTQMRHSVEHLANTVAALAKIQLNEDDNIEDTLRYTVTKMCIVRNAMEKEKQHKNIKEFV